jgi:hypothetical protein
LNLQILPDALGCGYHHVSLPWQPGLHDVPLKFSELLIVVDAVASDIGAVNDVKWTVARIVVSWHTVQASFG